MWNKGIGLSIFGESHGSGIGVTLDNLPSGEPIDMDKILSFMARRAPGKDLTSTPRQEKDAPEVLSGLYEGHTTGTPLAAVIRNTDTRSADYGKMSSTARPGHADYTGFLRYKGFNDVRGGGHFSGRLTAPLTFAGAVCGQILERRGIYTGAHIFSIMDVSDTPFDTIHLSREDILAMRQHPFPTLSREAERKMRAQIEAARLNLDSVGGVVECCTVGMPAGVGSPMFDGIENTIASLIFGIPAVKGLEFGAGFGASKLFGSQDNDPFRMGDNGRVETQTNHHGGILGGISSGMPISLRVAFKPTPSIAQSQSTIDYRTLADTTISIQGRHDPCIVPRAVPVVEACVNIALLGQLIACRAL